LLDGRDDEDELALEAHRLLHDADYTPVNPFTSTDFLHADHARRLVSLGRHRDARGLLIGTTNLTLLIEIATDRDFARVRDGLFVGDIDFRAAAEAEITDRRAQIEAYPTRMEPRMMLIHALRQAGRSEEALVEADAVLARHNVDADTFEDAGDFLNWVHNDRAYALYEIGRAEEGHAALRAGLSASEGGYDNVSQVINLTMMLIDDYQPEEALETLALLGDHVTDFGVMYAEAARACAAEQLGDAAELERALIYLRDHEADNTPARQRALLCADETDAAAELFIRRLSDRDERPTALRAVQNWQPMGRQLPYTSALDERLNVIKARPDVAAAIAEVGRVLDIPLPSAYWADH